jgi:ketose-bisphosphate aldolase
MEKRMGPPTAAIVERAFRMGTAVPAFNVPYLPMMAPIVEALLATETFGLIQVARLEWTKFEARSLKAVRDEYARVADPRITRLHLDHVPVVDEDGRRVDWEPILAEAIALGYDSLMLDASRLPLEENISTTRQAVALARPAGLPVEGELGAVFGHEAGPLPPYEELFQSGRGFTDPTEAARMVQETGIAWLSVAIGNIHGAISGAARRRRKVEARLNIAHLERLRRAVNIPLVLHGGSGIARACLREAIAHGIAKINVGTALRQAYEEGLSISPAEACRRVRAATETIVCDELGVAGSAPRLLMEP